jgi:hypothetical protein
MSSIKCRLETSTPGALGLMRHALNCALLSTGLPTALAGFGCQKTVTM